MSKSSEHSFDALIDSIVADRHVVPGLHLVRVGSCPQCKSSIDLSTSTIVPAGTERLCGACGSRWIEFTSIQHEACDVTEDERDEFDSATSP